MPSQRLEELRCAVRALAGRVAHGPLLQAARTVWPHGSFRTDADVHEAILTSRDVHALRRLERLLQMSV